MTPKRYHLEHGNPKRSESRGDRCRHRRGRVRACAVVRGAFGARVRKVPRARRSPGHFDVTCIDQQYREAARLEQFEQWHPVPASGLHGYDIDPADLEPIGQRVSSTVKLKNSRTGSSSRSGGTATKCEALPMSMPAALGWVMVRAIRDLFTLAVCFDRRWLMRVLQHSLRNVVPPWERRLAHSPKRDIGPRPDAAMPTHQCR